MILMVVMSIMPLLIIYRNGRCGGGRFRVLSFTTVRTRILRTRNTISRNSMTRHMSINRITRISSMSSSRRMIGMLSTIRMCCSYHV